MTPVDGRTDVDVCVFVVVEWVAGVVVDEADVVVWVAGVVDDVVRHGPNMLL
jgi:hypothetical protein